MDTLCDIPIGNHKLPSACELEVRRVDPLVDPEWDRLVASHPEGGFFHSSAWARVLVRTYGHRPFYLACYESDNLVALVPIMEVRSVFTGCRGVCVPFADSCGPLLFEGCDPSPVMKALSVLASERRWRHFELRGGPRLEPSAKVSVSFLGHSLDLSQGPDKLFAGFDSAVRRALRKAERGGLEISICSDRESVLAYYQLHVRTRRKHGLPPQPVSFFLNIHEEIMSKGLGSVVQAHNGATPAAAAIFFHQGKQAVYKFGASDERLLDSRGNNLVMWAGIRMLAERGYELLHFGRTSSSNEGLRRYKLGWGTTESTMNYFKFDAQTSAWLASKDGVTGAHNALFSRLPLPLNQFAGSMLYRHLD